MNQRRPHRTPACHPLIYPSSFFLFICFSRLPPSLPMLLFAYPVHNNNQLSTQRLYIVKKQATNELLNEPDWGVNVDLCDLVNSDFHRHGKDTVKALKLKMMKNGKPSVQNLALVAMEMCMKNCGAQYHVMVVVKDVLKEMMKLVLDRRCEGSVRRKTLELVEEWAAQLRIPQYREVYENLRSRGVEFPGSSGSDENGGGGGGRVPMHTPRQTVARGGGGGDLSALGDIDEADAAAIRAALAEAEAEVAAEEEAERAAAQRRLQEQQLQYQHQQHGDVPPSPAHGIPVAQPYDHDAAVATAARAAGASNRPAPHSEYEEEEPPVAVDASSPEAIAKLKSDLAVAANSVAVLRDMLDGIDPSTNPNAVNDDIVAELGEQCRQMRPRVVALVQSVSDEELLMAALALNDDLSDVLDKRDTLVAAAGADPETRAAVAASIGPGPARGATAGTGTAAEGSNGGADVGGGLVDDLDEFAASPASPAPASRTAAVVDPFSIGVDVSSGAAAGGGAAVQPIGSSPSIGSPPVGSPPITSPHMSRGPASAAKVVPPLAPPPGSSPSSSSFRGGGAGPASSGTTPTTTVTLDDLLGPMPETTVSSPTAAYQAGTTVSDPFAMGTAAAAVRPNGSADARGALPMDPFASTSSPPSSVSGGGGESSGAGSSKNPFGGGAGYGAAIIPPPPTGGGGSRSAMNPLFDLDEGMRDLSMGGGGAGAGGSGASSSHPHQSNPFAAPAPGSSSTSGPGTNPFLSVAPSSQQQGQQQQRQRNNLL